MILSRLALPAPMTSVHMFANWGIPLHCDKLESPATRLTILGIELDPLAFYRLGFLERNGFALPCYWRIGSLTKHKELESFIGHLQHTCQVVPQCRAFLDWMINLLYSFLNDNHPIRLKKDFHLDLTPWKDIFGHWNGLSFLLTPR